MKHSTVIADTQKGARIFLEGVTSAIGTLPDTFTVNFGPEKISIFFHVDGKRRVVASKGGVIDLQSKKVTQWARGATSAIITGPDATGTITITRG